MLPPSLLSLPTNRATCYLSVIPLLSMRTQSVQRTPRVHGRAKAHRLP
nr:hypothetical protein Q903MT_gene2325 [Picea sitchensis]